MFISEARFENYKVFQRTDPLTFQPALNVVVGRNNSGKTSLLELLSLDFQSNPHSSLDAPSEDRPSSTVISISLTPEELFDNLRALPKSDEGISVLFSTEFLKDAADMESINNALNTELQLLDCCFVSEGCTSAVLRSLVGVDVNQPLAEGYFDLASSERRLVLKTMGHPPRPLSENDRVQSTVPLANLLKQNIFYLRAERLELHQSSLRGDEELTTDASNLAKMLHVLQTNNPGRFDRYVSFVRKVFPEVKAVTGPVTHLDAPTAEIRVWFEDPAAEREDLARPLSECGSGVSQVLAMLYVAITSSQPSVILVDEPQTFLHPGAIRRLIGVLRMLQQHQYIIATHSTTVIAASEVAQIHLVRRAGSHAIIGSVDANERQSLQDLLSEVGARLSDVFGADAIVWVEGLTEEKCFPLILVAAGEAPLGTAIVALDNTGAFAANRKRDQQRAISLYQRLSKGASLLPPAIGFILDREQRTPSEMADLERMCDNLAFLGRRMYENYLLSPAAIAAVASEIENFRDEPLTEQEVEAWINRERKAFSGGSDESTDEEWLSEVDGAKLLKDLFGHFSENRVIYRKTEHSVILTERILQISPENLREIRELLTKILTENHQ